LLVSKDFNFMSFSHVMDLSWDREHYIMVSKSLVQTLGLYGKIRLQIGKIRYCIFVYGEFGEKKRKNRLESSIHEKKKV
jgi:hypothetical protein